MICSDIRNLIDYALDARLIAPEDTIVVRNLLMDLLRVADWTPEDGDVYAGQSVDDLLAPLIDYAVSHGIIEDTAVNRDLFDTRLMGLLTPMPRDVIRAFRDHYDRSPQEATAWYYDHSKKTNYVRSGRIAKDLKWQYESDFGTLDITINRSKPEKDPRDIAAARTSASTAYPMCQLCAENMGFCGTRTHPARQNLRPVPLNIHGQTWYLQYSPYGYYHEHCIVFNERHIPMVIDAEVFGKLFDFVEAFPHYFIGSNADLPIVGGSILSHEHFQGGNYTFAMAKAPVEFTFRMPEFPQVEAGVVNWAMSVIRLRGADREQLERACAHVLMNWRGYSDEAAGILAFTRDTPHNTVTPIARMRDGVLECDLVLRNNITSPDRPLGVYHPRPSLHHIKKENIGLIEVMGLAVLPARLAAELDAVKEALLQGADMTADPLTASHAIWAEDIKRRHAELCEHNATEIIRSEVGAVFSEVLCDAGVFKRDALGTAAFRRFIRTL